MSRTDDSDLRSLLQSPALSLEPPVDLSSDVRRQAGRLRTRRRATAGGVLAVVVLAGFVLGPALSSSVESLRNRTDQSAGFQPDKRFPAATTEVVTLRQINGAQVVTWFEGADWCTATTRVTRQKTCLGAVDPQHQGFSWVVPARSPSVTVDDQHVVAGIAPPGANRVIVHFDEGRFFEATIVDGGGFPVPVWSALLFDDGHGRIDYYAAFDSGGKEIARKKA
jgi:hypothetical protein